MSTGRNHLVLRAPEGDQRDNPFAPPPQGTPDQPWQPRGPHAAVEAGGTATGSDGRSGSPGASGASPQGRGPAAGQDGAGAGQGGASGQGGAGQSGAGQSGTGAGQGGATPPGGPQDGGTPPPPPPVWGSQWSSRQPQSGRPDPFARRPEGPQGSGPRFDPTDPAHRRSRYALVCGGWGMIFAFLGWTAIGLLLGALALYWGVSALRMSPEHRASARASAASALSDASKSPRPAPPAPGPDAQRSFLTAAWTGIVTSAVALAVVLATYGFQLAYHDYYTCKADALTHPAAQACTKLLPSPLRDLPAFRS